MLFETNQKVVVRRNRKALSDKSISLNDWIAHHCFVGEVQAVNGQTIEVCKMDSGSLYGKDQDKEIYLINIDSDEYDIQPLRTPPAFQVEPMAIAMF